MNCGGGQSELTGELTGVQGTGPLAGVPGVARGAAPLAEENFVFGGHKIRNFISIFGQKRNRKTAFENERAKN